MVIGEVAQTHDGSLGTAHAYVDAIARAGADAIKLQTHIAAAESTPGEPWRVKFSPQDASRYDYWRRMEFTEAQWAGLKTHAEERGILFLSSPFSFEAIELLERVGTCLWKVASGEIGNLPMLERMCETKLPVLLSSGMSPYSELDAAVALLRSRGAAFGVMQCTTSYPCPPERVGLNVLSELRERYAAWTGLSDHSATIFPGLAAATLGIDVLEVHVTMSREAFGPDVSSSLTTAELEELVRGVRFIEKMKANPMDKDAWARDAEPSRRLFTKSVVALRPILAGTVLVREDLGLKKPGTGIPAARLPHVLGRTLARDVALDQPIQEEDLEPSRGKV
ncbi:MAG: N-acetylneuraminate synthase family protein [Deltaproteobacteria bacterium]|nr:N-acetylneuraminate synthase family protein [Deltaproteobacteria bacterium]